MRRLRALYGTGMTVPLAHDDLGAGPVVVLVHGHPFNRALWDPQREPLGARFRLIVPDLRGYGASPATPGTVTMGELAADLEALLDSLGISTAALVGLSMGGLVTMELAIARPDRYWALGLIATTAEPVTEAERDDRLALAEAAERNGIEPVIARMRVGLFDHGVSPEIVRHVDAMMQSTDPAGAAAALRGRAQRPDYRRGLAALRIPAFVCAGTADPWSTAAVTKTIVDALHDPRSLILDGVGHLPNLEAAKRFNRELGGFLAEHAPAI